MPQPKAPGSASSQVRLARPARVPLATIAAMACLFASMAFADSNPFALPPPAKPLPVPATKPTTVVPENRAAEQPASNPALGVAFATRHARFEPVAFDQLPGWSSDNLRQSLKGLRQSCNALARKPAWSELCAEADDLGNADEDGIRRFFERNFFAYHVMSPEKRADGLITGYFEPILEGSHVRRGAFRYPVYGQPKDLLLVDSSSIVDGQAQRFRVHSGRLLAAAADDATARAYSVELKTSSPNIRDKRYRVRIEGNRILPYYSRQEIERRPLDAPVLAWVSDPFKLYSMQVQGSGKIRLQDGRIIRVGFAEQNGHPFLPRGNQRDVALASRVIKTRGMRMDDADSRGAVPGESGPSDEALARIIRDEALARIIADLDSPSDSPAPPKKARPRKATAKPRPATQPVPTGVADDAEVDRIVALLVANRSETVSGEAAPPTPDEDAAGVATSDPGDDAAVAAIIAALSSRGAETPKAREEGTGETPREDDEADEPHGASAPAPAPVAANGAVAITTIPDPSYVFFRGIADGPQGPVGALGVPLTAGRSLAVDPRTTPLGSPVFIATDEPGGGGSMERLMFAQDTGGAIRGSVRGDLFWGTGETAGRLALATNGSARMWLLLPRGQTLSSLKGTRTRGSSADALPDCVVDDPDLCVEE